LESKCAEKKTKECKHVRVSIIFVDFVIVTFVFLQLYNVCHSLQKKINKTEKGYTSVKILKIEIEIAEKSKETRVKCSPASIPTCELAHTTFKL